MAELVPRPLQGLERLRTARLDAVRLGLDDLDAMVEMWQDDAVTATLGGRRDATAVRAMVLFWEWHWDTYGYGEWMWHDRATGALVGRAGLRHVQIDGADEVEIGYSLNSPWWGRGLATEATVECARVAFDVIGLADLVAFTLPDNLRSQRVMTKAGFVYEKDVVHANLPHVLFRLSP